MDEHTFTITAYYTKMGPKVKVNFTKSLTEKHYPENKIVVNSENLPEKSIKLIS